MRLIKIQPPGVKKPGDARQTNATAIGLTVPQLAALNDKVMAAQTALQQAQQARLALAAATENLRQAVKAMGDLGSAAVRAIRFKAVSTNDPNVYVLAQIPAPKARSPVPAPGTPYGVAASLVPGGALKLKWRCKNPADSSGTIYEVRRAAGNGAMELIGTTGQKSFVDQSLAPGTPAVTYHLTAVRSTRAGEAAQFSVQFGTGPAGSIPAGGTSAGGTPAGGTPAGSHSASSPSSAGQPMVTVIRKAA